MKAAVVRSFGEQPRFEDFAVPVADDEDDLLVDVIAAGLHPRVRSQAAGSHYTNTDELPLVPGIDGVGRDADGQLRYFVLPDTAMGSMAEQTVVDRRRSVVLAPSCDPIAVAAAMNPAMSSWIALRQRIDFPPGLNVLVLGATGNAGRMAIQIAKLLGAAHIIGAGRDAGRLVDLAALGATATVVLDGATGQQLGAAAREVDVVLDYLWGEPGAAAMAALITGRADERRPLTWIQIGSVAGTTAPIPSAALRAARLQIVGSGQGSVGGREIVAELPALAELISSDAFDIGVQPMPLADVERAWIESVTTRQRIVLTP
jgi:NADPH:quinone reductase-like Zn-dependent oxidoreductase